MTLLALALAASAPAGAPAPAAAADAAVDAARIESVADTSDATVAGYDMQFICSDGHLIGLSRDVAAGVLRGVRGGDQFTLHQQVTRSGARRFVNGPDSIVLAGGVAWLTRGRQVHMHCERVPDAPVAGTVWGTVDTGNIAVPAGSFLKILLVDAARADAPAVEIASTMVQTSDNAGPFWYLLHFDPGRAEAPARAQLQARLRAGKSSTVHVSDSATPIPDDGTPPPSPIRLSVGHAAGK